MADPSEAASGSDELRPVTSLFADVVGSTGLGERLTPAEVKALIGECVSRMCEAVESLGGCVRSYMGDGIAAFFGIDITREDDAERAARAALEIRVVVSEYAREVYATWGIPDFNVRVGINSGRVAVGDVGASERQRVALGDSVNVAARLQSSARPGSIVVGEASAEELMSRFRLRPIGGVEVRGRRHAVVAFELEAEDLDSQSRPEELFVGRTVELDVLDVVMRQLDEGRGQIVFVRGESGLGKSRLFRELKRRAPSDVLWLDGHCDLSDERLPYEPFLQVLRSWLGLSRDASAIATRIRLNVMGNALFGSEFEDRAPHLARLLGTSFAPKLDRRLEGFPREVRESALIAAMRQWLIRLSAKSPVVIAVDNFGAASVATLDLTKALLGVVEEMPVLFLLAVRSDGPGLTRGLRTEAMMQFEARCQELRLRPLAATESRELIRGLAGRCEFPDALAELIAERAEGNPLYIEELFAAVEGGADSTPQNSALALPNALEGVLLARIDSLPPHARGVLQAAAVLGRRFSHEVLVRMFNDPRVDDAIALLLREDVIREQGRDPKSYAFRHGLIRDAALSRLVPQALRELNARAARALADWSGFERERDAAALATHYLASGRAAEAVEFVDDAAARLSDLCRWQEATALLEQCLDQIDAGVEEYAVVRLASRLAQVLAAQGQNETAIEWIDKALALGSATHVRLTIAKSRCLADLGDLPKAVRLIKVLLDSELDGALEVEATTLLGELSLLSDDLVTARACVEALGDVSSLEQSLAFSAASLAAGVLAREGRLDEAELWALHAQRIAVELGQVGHQLVARRRVAVICQLKGCVAEAASLMEQVYEEYAAYGFLTGQLESAINLLYVKHMAGDLSSAERIGESALEKSPSAMWTGMLAANLAVIKCEQGQYAQATALAELALRLNEPLPGWTRLSAQVVLAYVSREDGRLEDARAQLSRAYERASSEGLERERNFIGANLAELEMEVGALDAALSLVREMKSRPQTRSAVDCLSEDRVVATVLGVLNPDASLDMLGHVLRNAEQIGAKLEQARTLVAMGRLNPSGRQSLLSKARRIFNGCGSQLGIAEVDRASVRFESAPV
jgi:class 3 adenylate cyclase/tetratricopeptide (TPR) repeat protein